MTTKDLTAILTNLPAYAEDVLTPEEIMTIHPEIQEALTALHSYIETEIIGADEPNPKNGNTWHEGFEVRNHLRALQRQRLNGGTK